MPKLTQFEHSSSQVNIQDLAVPEVVAQRALRVENVVTPAVWEKVEDECLVGPGVNYLPPPVYLRLATQAQLVSQATQYPFPPTIRLFSEMKEYYYTCIETDIAGADNIAGDLLELIIQMRQLYGVQVDDMDLSEGHKLAEERMKFLDLKKSALTDQNVRSKLRVAEIICRAFPEYMTAIQPAVEALAIDPAQLHFMSITLAISTIADLKLFCPTTSLPSEFVQRVWSQVEYISPEMWGNMLDIGSHLSVVLADDVHVTSNGLELIYNQTQQKQHNPPLRRVF